MQYSKKTAVPEIPAHIAIIMDGNNRWAKRRFLPKLAGHRAAAKNLEKVVNSAASLGVQYLTLFAFSTENWSRPEDEVAALMKMLLKSLRNDTPRLHKEGIRLKIIGDKAGLSEELQSSIAEAELLTSDNKGMTLNLAINYGGIWDITQAAREIAAKVEAGKLRASEITDSMMESHLSTSGQPSVDLLIRTSGENRISNYLLWQCAYSEFYFTDVLWPDFNAEELSKAIDAFNARERRYGQTTEQLKPAR